MAFTNSFRMERVYFERLKSMIDILKPYLNTETDEKLKSILENSIDDNGAILLLYRNLGECWAELSDLIKKADEKIDSLNDKADKYHDELNERIDEVNNYIMGILREIEARLETVEQDLATLSRNIILDLERVNDEYTLSYKGDPVDFAKLAEWVSFPDNVIIRGVVNGEETVLHLREFDTDETSGVFEFFATGLIDNVVHEITVTVLPDDSVNLATEIQTMKEYSAGNGINIDSNDEISVDTDVIQEKLTAGSGISIDPDTHEITNTAQGKIYTAGSGIAIDPDTNEISNTAQGKIYTAGSGIAIDPDTHEITNTAPGKIYNGGFGIEIDEQTNDIVNEAPFIEEDYYTRSNIGMTTKITDFLINNISDFIISDNFATFTKTFSENVNLSGKKFAYYNPVIQGFMEHESVISDIIEDGLIEIVVAYKTGGIIPVYKHYFYNMKNTPAKSVVMGVEDKLFKCFGLSVTTISVSVNFKLFSSSTITTQRILDTLNAIKLKSKASMSVFA